MKNLFIIILTILVLSLGGYLVYDKVIVKNAEEPIKENNKVEENAYDLVKAKELVDKYTSSLSFWENRFEKQMTESDKIYLAMVNATSSDINYVCSEAFPEEKIEYGTVIIETEDFYGACFEGEDIYTYDSLNKTYKELFGNEKDIPKQLVSAGLFKAAYSEKYDAYIELSCECGGAPYPTSYYDVESAIEKEDTVEVIVNYVKFDYSFDSKIYSVANNSKINIIIEDAHNITNEQLKGLYNKALEQNSELKYKFIFKKSDTGYYLESITKQLF